MRRFTLGLTASVFLATASVAQAESWSLIVQPAPYSQSPPAYSSWYTYRGYSDLQSCLGDRMTLHYDLWQSDRDLSMRALSGACRSDSTGQIVNRVISGEEEEDW